MIDEDLNELLLKKIKLDEEDDHQHNYHNHSQQQDDETTLDSMDYSNTSDEDESRSRDQLITLLRSYIKSKLEKKRKAEAAAAAAAAYEDELLERESEDAQMFKSIRAMMLETSSGGSGGGASNTTSIEEDVNNDDGLDQHAELPGNSGGDGDTSGGGDYDDDELPSNLIVTGLPNELFSSVELKRQFESMFTSCFALDNHDHSSSCRFAYFRLLKRCCVQFDEPIVAVLARLELDRVLFMGAQLKMYLNKPIKLKNTRPFLEPPKNDKTFLISPPSSPPVGWEQNIEDPPVVNLDLLVALSKLDPHEPCELIKSEGNMPGIIVHPCPDEYIDDYSPDHNRQLRFIPTRRPPNCMN